MSGWNRKTLSRFKNALYLRVFCAHNTACAPNAHTQRTSNVKWNEPGIWNSTYPLPAFNGALANVDNDRVMMLVEQKKEFVTDLDKIKNAYQRDIGEKYFKSIILPNEYFKNILCLNE